MTGVNRGTGTVYPLLLFSYNKGAGSDVGMGPDWVLHNLDAEDNLVQSQNGPHASGGVMLGWEQIGFSAVSTGELLWCEPRMVPMQQEE